VGGGLFFGHRVGRLGVEPPFFEREGVGKKAFFWGLGPLHQASGFKKAALGEERGARGRAHSSTKKGRHPQKGEPRCCPPNKTEKTGWGGP